VRYGLNIYISFRTLKAQIQESLSWREPAATWRSFICQSLRSAKQAHSNYWDFSDQFGQWLQFVHKSLKQPKSNIDLSEPRFLFRFFGIFRVLFLIHWSTVQRMIMVSLGNHFSNRVYILLRKLTIDQLTKIFGELNGAQNFVIMNSSLCRPFTAAPSVSFMVIQPFWSLLFLQYH
jgi:hypothetical protein